LQLPKGVSDLALVETRDGEYTFAVRVDKPNRIDRNGIRKLAHQFCKEHGIEIIPFGSYKK